MTIRERQRERYSPTGAHKIENESFELYEVSKDGDENHAIEIKNLNLDDYQFSASMEIKLEVKQKSGAIETYNFGTVQKPRSKSIKTGFSKSRGKINARLNITKKGNPDYQGFSNWRHVRDANKTQIFDIEGSEDLGCRLWDHIFGAEDEYPTFQYNKNIDGINQMLMEDNLVKGLVLPNFIKAGYLNIAETNFEQLSAKGSWQSKWWEYAKSFKDNLESFRNMEDKISQEDYVNDLVNRIFNQDNLFIESINDYISEKNGNEV